ncbi:hypothetical protein BOTNAR_0689g00010 [Botryotinia narcissicola]|uniref:Uncharacterized protein n=1 Tax=Botryotinia narcissicola TaxID=278944 RepID=A0A4Z1HJJ0_9HELO|nr:hypothetical protein BOTNAR_0689g00010 [Botryotinia narcissicola]
MAPVVKYVMCYFGLLISGGTTSDGTSARNERYHINDTECSPFALLSALLVHGPMQQVIASSVVRRMSTNFDVVDCQNDLGGSKRQMYERSEELRSSREELTR